MDDNPTERELGPPNASDGGGSRVPKTVLYATRFLDLLVGSLFPCLFGDGGGSAEDRAVQGECESYTGAKEICGFRSVSTESGDRDENRTDELIQCFPYCPDDSEDEPVQPDDPKVLGVGSHGDFPRRAG